LLAQKDAEIARINEEVEKLNQSNEALAKEV